MTVTLGLIFVASLKKAWPRTFLAVRCLHCPRAQIVHRGTTARGTPRSLCQPTRCPQGSVRRASAHRGGVPAVQPTMLDMRLNARGGAIQRGRCLAVPPRGGVHSSSKPPCGKRGTPRCCAPCTAPRRRRGRPWGRWLGPQATRAGAGRPSLPPPGKVCASVLGRRTDAVFGPLQALREPWGLPHSSTASGGPPPGIWLPTCRAPAHATPRSASGSI